MNGYVNFREDYAHLIVSAFTTGDPDPNYHRDGAFKYVKALFQLNKPIYFSTDVVRGYGNLLREPYLEEAYLLTIDAAFARVQVTFTQDDYIRVETF